jgi:hypothetical protein
MKTRLLIALFVAVFASALSVKADSSCCSQGAACCTGGSCCQHR